MTVSCRFRSLLFCGAVFLSFAKFVLCTFSWNLDEHSLRNPVCFTECPDRYLFPKEIETIEL